MRNFFNGPPSPQIRVSPRKMRPQVQKLDAYSCKLKGFINLGPAPFILKVMDSLYHSISMHSTAVLARSAFASSQIFKLLLNTFIIQNNIVWLDVYTILYPLLFQGLQCAFMNTLLMVWSILNMSMDCILLG